MIAKEHRNNLYISYFRKFSGLVKLPISIVFILFCAFFSVYLTTKLSNCTSHKTAAMHLKVQTISYIFMFNNAKCDQLLREKKIFVEILKFNHFSTVTQELRGKNASLILPYLFSCSLTKCCPIKANAK